MSSPFGEDYPELRDVDTIREERRRVDRQIDGLRQMQDPAYSAEFIGRLQERRQATAAVQLETVARDGGGQAYVAGGSALVDRAAVTDGNRADLLAELGLVVVDTDPRSSLVRVEPAGATDRRTAADVVERLRTDGAAAVFNYIVPLGGVVMKAEGGPENSAHGRPFPAVAIPQSGAAPLVAVIDTGVSLEQRTDGYLQNLVQPDNVDALDVLPFPITDDLLDAAAGHGAFVAGVVQQVAPSARLRIHKVTGPDGICTDQQVGEAIRRAAAEGADIINLSLGTSTVDDTPPPAMLAAIQDVVNLRPDILIVVAAGNDGDEVPVWPAALARTPSGSGMFDQVVSVAGLDPGRLPSVFSSRGEWVTCSTIGEGVVSTYVIGTEDGPLIKDPVPDTFKENSWAVWTGSSFAAPQITGGVARLCHESGRKPLEALADLLRDAPDDLPGWGKRVTILPGTPVV
jgi:hypothetical protein